MLSLIAALQEFCGPPTQCRFFVHTFISVSEILLNIFVLLRLFKYILKKSLFDIKKIRYSGSLDDVAFL